MARRFYRGRHWWYSPRTPLFWRTATGCYQWDRHWTWRYA